MKFIFIYIVFFIKLVSFIHGQPVSISWSKCFGGTNRDVANSVLLQGINRITVIGSTRSFDGDVLNHHGTSTLQNDFWDFEIDSLGLVTSSKCFGGSNGDVNDKAILSSDKGLIMIGYTSSYDNDVSGLHGAPFGGPDFWIVKTDSLENLIWQKCIGGTNDEFCYGVSEGVDSSVIICGGALSIDDDAIGNHGSYDILLSKISKTGNLMWNKMIGGSGGDIGSDCILQPDGSILLSAGAASHDYDIHCSFGNSSPDAWITKLDSSGNILISSCVGGSDYDDVVKMFAEPNGCIYFCGNTASIDGDVSGGHGSVDVWLVKLDSLGSLVWQQCYGGSSLEDSNYGIRTSDGGFLIVGNTYSNDGQISGHYPGSEDGLVIKTDSLGNLLWSLCLGGSQDDNLYGAVEFSPYHYLVTGETASNDYDVSGNHGDKDAWVVSLVENPNVVSEISPIALSQLSGSIEFGELSFKFTSEKSEEISISLFEITGKEILSRKTLGVVGQNEFKYPVSISRGIYLLKIYSSMGTSCLKISCGM